MEVLELNANNIISLSMSLKSGEEDSSIDVSFYEPNFTSLLSSSRFDLTTRVGNKTFKFAAQIDSFDLSTLVANAVGNSAAWEYNQVRSYRIWQETSVSDILNRLGVTLDSSVPASVRNQRASLVQNNTTDYRFAYGVCAGLGLRLSGNTQGSGMIASLDKPDAEPVLSVSAVFDGTNLIADTDEAGVSVSGLSFSQSDETESAKTEPGNQPQVASEGAEKPKEQTKYRRINPATGVVAVSNDDINTTARTTNTAAKKRELSWSLNLIVVSEESPQFLLQPGDIVNISVTDASGKTLDSSCFVDSITYKVYPEHSELTVELKQPLSETQEQ